MTEPNERIARFGHDDQLLGIVTLPEDPRADAPGCLLMNAGVVHRIGPHRLNVKIARALAADGITSIRVDLSGLGDSPPAPGSAHFGEQTLRDLRAAMAHLEATQGIRRFVVFGLCSGAMNGYRLALADDRIAGLLMFDGYVYPTLKTHVLRRWYRFRTSSWGALARKPAQWMSRKRPDAEPGDGSDDTHLGIPSRPEFARAMATLVDRGTSVYLYYSASFIEGHNYHGQLRDAFRNAPFLDRIRYDYEPDIDHTVTSIDAQHKVIASIRDWVQSVASSGGSSGSST